MLTPNSSLTSYATPDDMLVQYDIRAIADLLNDRGVRTGGSPNPDPAIVAVDPVLQAMLDKASGMVEAACLRSLRYSPADLQGLTGVSLQLLVGIVCDLAMGYLYRRRPDKGKPPAAFGEALKWLEDLASGERIFSFQETEAAALPSVHVETPAEICERSLVAQEAFRYFGVTGDLLRRAGCAGGCGGGGPGC